MILLDYYYDYDIREAHFEFSMPDDGDMIRTLDLEFDNLCYYSSDIIDEDELFFLTDSFVKDIIDNYIKEKGLPSDTYY